MRTSQEPDAENTTHHLTHQWSGETSLSETIVTAIAEYAAVDVDTLPPIEECVDPDALDALFATDSDTDPTGCVTFSYYGYTILVQSTGQVLIRHN